MKKLLATLTVLALLAAAPAALGEEETPYINNPNPKDRLHLRSAPSRSAQSLGKYYNGAMIEVLDASIPGWVKVRVGGEPGALTGYMQSQFIVYAPAGDPPPVQSAMPEYASDSVLTVYFQPSASAATLDVSAGLSVFLIGFTDRWWHVAVQIPGEGDYTYFLPAGGAGLKPAGSQARTYAHISNPDPKDRLHLRATPSLTGRSLGKYYNGTIGTVLGYSKDGKWVKVDLYGRQGYMQRGFLTLSGETNNTLYAIPTIQATAAKPVLYELPDTANSRKKALQTGTDLETLGIVDSVWLHVRMGTLTGFIRRSQTNFVDNR